MTLVLMSVTSVKESVVVALLDPVNIPHNNTYISTASHFSLSGPAHFSTTISGETRSPNGTVRIVAAAFYRPDVLTVSQPAVSKY